MKPGQHCYLVRLKDDPDWNGRVVTLLKYYPEIPLYDVSGAMVIEDGSGWDVEAPWLPQIIGGRFNFGTRNLLPIEPDTVEEREREKETA